MNMLLEITLRFELSILLKKMDNRYEVKKGKVKSYLQDLIQ